MRAASLFVILISFSFIPLAIIGANHFYSVLVAIVSKFCLFLFLLVRRFQLTTIPLKKPDIIGYWSSIFLAIILTEHLLFRKNNFDSYQIEDWDKPNKLPIGVAALLAFLGGFGMVIPSMSQMWYTGPIAEAGTGDIGVLTGSVVGAVLYAILRGLEKKTFLGR